MEENMKKFLYIILVSCFSLAIISCAEKDESTAEKDESTTTATTTTTTTTLSAPSTLTATGGTGQVTLDWTSVMEPQATQYIGTTLRASPPPVPP
tara:strand:- start:221 stop:505 length:285 start_codon:yes stop_codon:yes gene_type:complete